MGMIERGLVKSNLGPGQYNELWLWEDSGCRVVDT